MGSIFGRSRRRRIKMINQRDIVLIYFPFSNGQRSKLRPVLVISNDTYHKEFQDFLGIAITSNLNTRFHTIKISNDSMEMGILKQESLVKVDKIASIEQSKVKITIGRIKKDIFEIVKNEFLSLI
jgi:mRNA interferase MazF